MPRSAKLATSDAILRHRGSRSDHILVVDDDSDIREPIAECLRKSGLRASVVATGRAMRAVLDISSIDLIALDDLRSLWRKRSKSREPFIHSAREVLIKLTDSVRRFLRRATVDPQIPGRGAGHH